MCLLLARLARLGPGAIAARGPLVVASAADRSHIPAAPRYPAPLQRQAWAAAPACRPRHHRVTCRPAAVPRARPLPATAFDFIRRWRSPSSTRDNFNLTSTNKIQDFRSTISPGFARSDQRAEDPGHGLDQPGHRAGQRQQPGGLQPLPEPLGGGQACLRPQAEPEPRRHVHAERRAGPRQPVRAPAAAADIHQQHAGLSADWLLDRVATQGYYQLSTFFSVTRTPSARSWGGRRRPAGRAHDRQGRATSSPTSVPVPSPARARTNRPGNLIWASVARKSAR